MSERQACFNPELEGFPRHKYDPQCVLENIKPSTIQQQQLDDDPIFYKCPNILIRCDRISEFYPARHLSKTRKFNAIARFVLYFAILYFFASGNAFLPLIGLCSLYLIAKCYLPRWTETFCQTSRQCGGLGFSDLETDIQHQNRWFREDMRVPKPTCDNPFMNPTVNDFLTKVDLGPAPDISQEPIASQVNNLFTDQLYLDIDDIWQRRNGQRQFVTNPNTTIPNDQEGFARFLFDNPNHAGRESYICKNDKRFNHSGPNIKSFNGLCK